MGADRQREDDGMITVSLCESCIWSDAYGEALPDSDATPLSKLEGYLIGSLPCEHGYDCRGCDSPSVESYFGRVCDGCDTRYAGHRYDYVVVTA
jgi:hypothetical protein